MSLRDELKMQRPFAAVEQEAIVSIIATKARVEEMMVRMLGRFRISRPQFNILRILRGAHPGSLTRSEIFERLVEKNPDVTRLVDRLESAGLVRRERGSADRRQMFCQITAKGAAVLKEINREMLALEKELMSPLTPAQQRQLVDHLQRIRDHIRTLE